MISGRNRPGGMVLRYCVCGHYYDSPKEAKNKAKMCETHHRETLEKVRELSAQGLSDRHIATRMGRSHRWVQERRYEMGLDSNVNPKNRSWHGLP